MTQAFNHNRDSFNVSNSYNTTSHNYTVRDNEPEILAWLSPLEPWARHHDIGLQRMDRIGAWLLETSEFRDWHNGSREANYATLFCDGSPGVGKSHIV